MNMTEFLTKLDARIDELDHSIDLADAEFYRVSALKDAERIEAAETVRKILRGRLAEAQNIKFWVQQIGK